MSEKQNAAALTGTSATTGSDQPYGIRLFVKGEDSGCYFFETQEEADEHYEWSKTKLGALGCRYKKEYPND